MTSKNTSLEKNYNILHNDEVTIYTLNTKDILKTAIPEIILKLKGTHFMRWADLDIKFQRPIRWIVSLFNNEIVTFEIANVKLLKLVPNKNEEI